MSTDPYADVKAFDVDAWRAATAGVPPEGWPAIADQVRDSLGYRVWAIDAHIGGPQPGIVTGTIRRINTAALMRSLRDHDSRERAARTLRTVGVEPSLIERYIAVMEHAIALETIGWDDLTRVIARIGAEGRLASGDADILIDAGYEIDVQLVGTAITWEGLLDHMEGQSGWLTRVRSEREEEAAIMPDTTRTDHAVLIHAALGNVLAGQNQDREFEVIMDHTDALAAERDTLRAYALWLQDHRGSDIYGEACPSDTEIAEAQAEYGVSGLLRDA